MSKGSGASSQHFSFKSPSTHGTCQCVGYKVVNTQCGAAVGRWADLRSGESSACVRNVRSVTHDVLMKSLKFAKWIL